MYVPKTNNQGFERELEDLERLVAELRARTAEAEQRLAELKARKGDPVGPPPN